ncbi:MAG TPA: hypothetical protein VFE62_08590 [Gemmataceae bacterium]|nr:hypothetical protein [Gemmataceae bacterium]
MARWRMLLIAPVLFASCRQQPPPRKMETPTRLEAKGLHNVIRINERLLSGSSPEGDEGFRSLQELGVKTIITVDGTKPEVERAHKFGMRYVHLPVGYDGIDRPHILRLAKAARDLPGPVYIHCHHGKHRGPTAAAAIALCLDERCTIADALGQMKLAGTDPHYTGLYKVPGDLKRPSKQELDAAPSDFPETTKVSALAEVMVEIDHRIDNLKFSQTSNWKTPANHPDVDPAHEALQVAEQFREAGRLDSTAHASAEFGRWLQEAEEASRELEKGLRRASDRSVLDASMRKLSNSCGQCHAKYRDVR